MIRLSVAASLMALALTPARAETPLSGSFVAARDCPALQSIKRETNPGNVRVMPGRSYSVLAGNTEPPTHYYLDMPDANPSKRWVAVECGSLNGAAPVNAQPPSPTLAPPSPTLAPPAGAVPPPAQPRRGLSSKRTDLLLSLSWQPTFCAEIGSGKPECRMLDRQSWSASHFSLHGLWPQPRGTEYCGVSSAAMALDRPYSWSRIPMPPLSPEVRKSLEQVMPGTQSHLEKHEWIKHGTCFAGSTPDSYFGLAVALAGEVNASSVQKLFAGNIGRTVSIEAVRKAFEADFGWQAGQKVRMVCRTMRGQQVISEIGVNVTSGDGSAKLAELMADARPVAPGCREGLVLPAGR